MPEPTSDAQITDEVRRHAADYAASARNRFGDASFESLADRLAEDWTKQQDNRNADWSSVRDIVQEAWNRRTETKADAISNNAGFESPPTFADAGDSVPRNLDEPNQ